MDEVAPLPEVERQTGGRPFGFWVAAAVAVLLAAVVAVAGAIWFSIEVERRPVPEFPALADEPDPSLHGTVAYVEAGCVRVVAASGQPDVQLWCLPATTSDATVGKDMGARLAWRDDGRLEVTRMRMLAPTAGSSDEPAPIVPVEQVVIDVRTGDVEEVPPVDGRVATTPVDRPTVGDAGTLVVDGDAGTGEFSVVVEAPADERTLLEVHGPGKLAYSIGSASWSPDGSYVLVDDGRILVVTTGPDPETRVLVDQGGQPAGPLGEFPTWAATGEDLLAAGS